MSERSLEPQTRRWLNWEFRAALITVVGGALAAIALIAYMHYRAASQEKEIAARRANLAATMQTAAQVCTAALAAAKNFGIVPNYAVLGSMFPTATQVKGRYVCAGRTTVAQYNIAVDLLCRELKNPRCSVLYSVQQQDGTVLYKRRG
jgi:type II secretory pathway pseudopilin PulG